MPTIRLATVDDMRSITSQNLHEIRRLPFVYIATPEPDVMRVWAWPARRRCPTPSDCIGALVAPSYTGERALRGDLLYNGAEPAADFIQR